VTILFLSHSDTDLLTLRSVVEGLPDGFPAVRAANPSTLQEPPPLDGVDLVVIRLLGGHRSWEPFPRRVRGQGHPAARPRR
jgi:cobaltochelatase CobN